MAQHLVVHDFSLKHTLECGQFFRRRCADGVYTVQRRELVFRVWQDDNRLYYTDVPAWFVRQFFALDHDLPSITRSIDRDPWIHDAIRRYWGLRIVRQDPWECTAAFLTSIASNIPRITRNIEDIAQEFGCDARATSCTGRQFPLPAHLSDEQKLRQLRLGFRAKYLVDAARLANAGLLDDVVGMPETEARLALKVMPGVADKVADCILLFAYGHLDAFPVDTWIRRVMSRLYFEGRSVTDLQIRQFAARYFGRYAGYAQQYLYVYSRQNWSEIERKRAPKSDTAIIRELAHKVLARRTAGRVAVLAR